jgi:tRNA-specific 2-thiouridylase
MSGGVDSSTAAFLLKREGFEVHGLSILLFETRGRTDPRSCCSLEAVNGAKETARLIGVPHKIINARIEFMEKVIRPFAEAYATGRTPNPCILCNRHIKFPLLLEEARKTGAEFIATGHYARVQRDGEVLLKKALDEKKDQSYVLYALRSEELERLVQPLGTYTKEDIRCIARENSLPVFDRPESQEICFVEGKDYLPFVRLFAPDTPSQGPIYDEKGEEVGRHRGIYAYTIGQRKGLGVPSLSPLYVFKIDPQLNAIHVGPRENALFRSVFVKELNWLVKEKPAFPLRAEVKIRSMMRPAPALMTELEADFLRVDFDLPQWAPAPGQSAVFYDGDTVLGGGIIEKVEG